MSTDQAKAEGALSDKPSRRMSDLEFSQGIEAFLDEMINRQSEIIRLSKFMDERSDEVDSVASRAKELIQGELDDPLDEDGIQRLISIATGDINDVPGGKNEGDRKLDEDERLEAIARALQDIDRTIPEGHFGTYLNNVIRALGTPPAESFLRSSLLVTLVGELEMMVGRLIKLSIAKNPESLKNSSKQFTWQEVSSHQSLRDFVVSVVDSEMEDVLRGSLINWMEFFESKHKIHKIDIARSHEAQELFQRRHCIAHNAGYASPQYVRNLGAYETSVEVGDKLRVDSKYLNMSADTLFLIFFSLLWSLTVKFCKDDEAKKITYRSFCNCTYRLLQDRRYDLIIKLGEQAPFHLLSDKYELIAKVNVWLAYKKSGRFDEVRQEVEEFDVAAKSRDFELARYALLDDVENAGRIADTMIRDEKLKKEHYLTWPLLSGVREARREDASTD